MPRKPINKKSKKDEFDEKFYFMKKCYENISLENKKNSVKIMDLTAYVRIMEKFIEVNSSAIELMARYIGQESTGKSKTDFANTTSQIKKSPYKKEESKANARIRMMHDDVTIKCPNCKTICISKDINCLECGHKI